MSISAEQTNTLQQTPQTKKQMLNYINVFRGFAILAIVALICNFVYVNGDLESKFYAIGAGGIVSTIFAVITAAMVFAEKSLK